MNWQSSYPLNKRERLIVALSGGADSVALLRWLHQEDYALLALHCNFHLRGAESDRDEAFVRHLCQELNIPLEVKAFDTKTYATQQGISIEMAARELRYAWFEEVRKREGIDIVCVAHHADDQAETLLLNLIRGTGLRGLCAMHPRQGHIVRPLLHVRRSELMAYLEQIGQTYVTDSTNLQADEARRNRIRLDILPLLRELNPNVDVALCQLATIVQQALPLYMEGVGNRLLEAHAEVDRFPLSLLREPLATTLLHEWLLDKGFHKSQQLEMLQAADKQVGRIWLSATHRVLREREALQLETLASEAPLPKICIEEVPQLGEFHAQCIYCDADRLDGKTLTLRPIQQGDRMVPFGMKGSKLVSDVLTGCKVNRFERERQMVLCAGEDIVWLVGIRADNRFRVDDHTQHIWRITLQ